MTGRSHCFWIAGGSSELNAGGCQIENSVQCGYLLLATIERALILIAFADFSQIFGTILGVAKSTRFASFLRIRRLGIVEF